MSFFTPLARLGMRVSADATPFARALLAASACSPWQVALCATTFYISGAMGGLSDDERQPLGGHGQIDGDAHGELLRRAKLALELVARRRKDSAGSHQV